MKKRLIKKIAASVLGAALVGAVSVNAHAHFGGVDGYLTDTKGSVVKNSYGQCWRTGTWTPAMATAECDPDLVKKADKKPEAAAPSAPAATPAAPAAGPEKPAFEKVRLQAETLFDFDKSVLRAEGKDKLNEVVSNMKSSPQVEVVLVTGHTDRIGSNKYNQGLSERRAAAVKSYLVSQGVAADRIKTEGKGESEPVTKPADCKGKKGSKLIACLQPDRRVVVEVGVQRPTRK